MAHWTFFCFTLLVNCLIFSFSSAQEQNAPVTSKISGLPIADKLCEYQKNADVVFLIDGSSSITQDNFDKILFIVQTIVNDLDIDSGTVRTALVQFSGSFLDGKNILHFNLDRYNNRADMQKAISSVSYLTGFTQTGNALLYTLESVFKSHVRPNAVKILIFISDGGANNEFEAEADQMKAFGVDVFSIGVGEVNYNTLQVIASDPGKKHVTQFIDLSDMQEIITILSDILCPSAETTTTPVSPPSPEPVSLPQVTTEPASPPSPEPASLPQETPIPVSPPSPEPVTLPQVTTEPASPPSPEPVTLPQETPTPVSPTSPEPVTQPQVTTALVSPASPEPVTQPKVTAPAVKECLAEQKADLVFLLDGSTSVTEDNFMKVLTAVQMIVDSLNIGADKVRVALVQYSGSFFGGKNTLHFNLDRYNNAADVHKAISSVSYMKGFTYTGKALDYTLKNVFQTKARPSVAKLLILITDGNANDIITIPAKRVKDFGVTVYSIGVGNINPDQLKEIASDPDSEHVFTVENFANLEKILQQLGSNICNEAQV